MLKKATSMCVVHLYVLVHVVYIITLNVWRYVTTVWL